MKKDAANAMTNLTNSLPVIWIILENIRY